MDDYVSGLIPTLLREGNKLKEIISLQIILRTDVSQSSHFSTLVYDIVINDV